MTDLKALKTFAKDLLIELPVAVIKAILEDGDLYTAKSFIKDYAETKDATFTSTLKYAFSSYMHIYTYKKKSYFFHA